MRILLFFIYLWPNFAFATRIQILHTNDLHASLETSGAARAGEEEYGSWARIKKRMDELTNTAMFPPEGAPQGPMETVRLDAGDFTEGTLTYFPDGGVHVLKAFQHMGYDAVTLGNHDWMMGARDMDTLYGKAPFPFPVLSANVKISPKLTHLKQQILPTTQIIRDGIRIGIVGLSTNESLYRWIPGVNSNKRDLQIKSYLDTTTVDPDEDEPTLTPGIANLTISELRKHNDVVIALTHIGFDNDQILASQTRGLDLIIGGHSHTILESGVEVNDLDGHPVQIVQTGVNGHNIGKIVLNVNPKANPTVSVEAYELVPVVKAGETDPQIEKDVEEAKTALSAKFGTSLNQVIGTSEERLVSGEAGPTSFSKFVVDAMRESTQAEAAFDVGAFHGNTPQAAGTITRKNLMEMYPRKFESSHDEGLYIYECLLPGILIEAGLRYSLKYGMFVSSSGVSYEVAKHSDGEFAKIRAQSDLGPALGSLTPYYPINIKIAGEPIRALRWYHVAAPESLIRGALGVSPLFKIVIRKAHSSTHTIWDAMNTYLLKTGKIPALSIDPFAPWINDQGSIQNVIQDSLKEVFGKVSSKDLSDSAPDDDE